MPGNFRVYAIFTIENVVTKQQNSLRNSFLELRLVPILNFLQQALSPSIDPYLTIISLIQV